jgi:hypothetical protein
MLNWEGDMELSPWHGLPGHPGKARIKGIWRMEMFFNSNVASMGGTPIPRISNFGF